MQYRNEQQEAEVLEWISDVLGEKLPSQPFEDVLKNGVVLCRLMNKIQPNSIKRIKESGTAFQLMENIQAFQAAIKKYGVPHNEIFQTADLFERRNLKQVTLTMLALARITQLHPEYTGPTIGPKMAEENKRNFSEEEIRRMRDADINLLTGGQNKGATQSGQNMGQTRHM